MYVIQKDMRVREQDSHRARAQQDCNEGEEEAYAIEMKGGDYEGRRKEAPWWKIVPF